jgi:cytochrome c oxidase subunit 1
MYTGLGVIIINLLMSLKNKKTAPANPWGGATLEWTIPSPPPVENFEEIPVVTKKAYQYE